MDREQELLRAKIDESSNILRVLLNKSGDPPPISDEERVLFRLLLQRRGISSNHYLTIEGLAVVIAASVNPDDGMKVTVEILPNDLFASLISLTRNYLVRDYTTVR